MAALTFVLKGQVKGGGGTCRISSQVVLDAFEQIAEQVHRKKTSISNTTVFYPFRN